MRKGYLSGCGGSCGDRMCGADDCLTCRPGTALAFRWHDFHYTNDSGEHTLEQDGCLECARAAAREEEWEE